MEMMLCAAVDEEGNEREERKTLVDSMTNLREEAERGKDGKRKRGEGREREAGERKRTKEAVCGEQGIESPSETNKN